MPSISLMLIGGIFMLLVIFFYSYHRFNEFDCNISLGE